MISWIFTGLHLVASTLVKQGGFVFVEDPTYFLALDVLNSDLGLHVRTFLAVDSQLEQLIVSEKQNFGCTESTTKDSRYWGMIYVIPNFQNPTGRLMSREDSQRLIDFAKKYKLLVVCDDVYNM